MRSWLGRISSSRTLFLFALVWATVIVLVVHLLDFPGSVPNFREMSGGGILLDASPASTPDEIYQRFAEYGEQGRQNYSFRNLSVDIVLPLSVFPFLFLLALRASTTLARRGLFFGFLLALPVVYVMFDLMENATILRLLADYPTRMNGLATSLPYSTTIKRAASL